MKKYIHMLAKRFGYKISNISQKEQDLKNPIDGFGVQNDTNDLVLKSAPYLFEIKKYFPELVLESLKDGVLACFNDLKLYIENIRRILLKLFIVRNVIEPLNRFELAGSEFYESVK